MHRVSTVRRSTGGSSIPALFAAGVLLGRRGRDATTAKGYETKPKVVWKRKKGKKKKKKKKKETGPQDLLDLFASQILKLLSTALFLLAS